MKRAQLFAVALACPFLFAMTTGFHQRADTSAGTRSAQQSSDTKTQSLLDSGPLHSVLENFAARSTPEQYAQVFQAIASSRQLAMQLNDLAQTGLFDGINVSGVKKNGIFGAFVDRTKIVFTADYLQAVAHTQPYDVRPPGAVLPNNLTFVLDHLAYHLRTARTAPTPSTTPNPLAFARAKIADEAVADIQGWNDVVDAAEAENSGKPLSPAQVGYLLLSLRYRVIFLKAGKQPSQKLEYAQDGRIELNQKNIDAVAVALANMNLFDIE